MSKAKSARKVKAKVAWRTDRITDVLDEATGRHVVDLPTVPGMTATVRDTLFTFEAANLGTVKAVIRMNKRAAGETPVTPHRLVTIGIPKGLAAYFGPVWAAPAASGAADDGISAE